MTRYICCCLLVSITSCSPGDQPIPAPTVQLSPIPSHTAGDEQSGKVGESLHGTISPLKGTISDFKVTISDTETIIELPADVLFAFDSPDLSTAAQSPLRRTLDLIEKSPNGDIRVVGYTDAKGEETYKMSLSQRRALSIRDWLGANGVAENRIKPEGRGEADPVAPNDSAGGVDNPAGRALNRRVMIYIPRSQNNK